MARNALATLLALAVTGGSLAGCCSWARKHCHQDGPGDGPGLKPGVVKIARQDMWNPSQFNTIGFMSTQGTDPTRAWYVLVGGESFPLSLPSPAMGEPGPGLLYTKVRTEPATTAAELCQYAQQSLPAPLNLYSVSQAQMGQAGLCASAPPPPQ